MILLNVLKQRLVTGGMIILTSHPDSVEAEINFIPGEASWNIVCTKNADKASATSKNYTKIPFFELPTQLAARLDEGYVISRIEFDHERELCIDIEECAKFVTEDNHMKLLKMMM